MEISKVLDPIAGELSAGSDVRYDPLFDALQSEVEKLTSPVYVGIVDWEGVVELACDILEKKSKDLVVTSYLAVALLHTRHSEGVLPALRLYHGMLEKFWDDLYPAKSKVRGRILSVEWWLEKTLQALQGGKASLPAAQGGEALQLLEEIDALLRERLPGGPSLEPLKRYFVEGEKGGEALPEEAAPPAPAGSVVASLRQERGVVTAERDGDVEGALQRVRHCALLLRQEEPCNPAPYRLLRGSLWGTVSALPPALEGRTRIAAPDHQQTALLRELRQKRPADALLEASEGRLPQFIFWLDLNRLSFEALGLLGNPFVAAQAAIAQETLHLVRRLPGLSELSFCDGTPFADAETRRWLQQSLPPHEPPCLQLLPHPPAAPPEGGEDALSAALREAQLLAREGKLPEGVHLLHDRLQGGRCGRERLLWRMALVEFLLLAGDPRLPLPQLEELLAEVDHYTLESYDPALALSGLKLAYHCFHTQREPAFQEKAQQMLFRIGRLDPAEMVRLQQGREIS